MPIRTHRDASLRIADLGKQYANGHWGLRHATATIASGRMTAVLGPNGAGKSTLIHMIAGAIQPSEGSIELTDPVARIGWSSQRTTIDWYLNVLQNVTMGGRLYGIDRRTCDTRARELLEQFRLGDKLTADVSMLSGGQQQRIQVARTLLSDPDIMLLDEPTASLDVESSESVLGLIRDRVACGATALISSHDLGLLERYCDDVLFILGGELIAHQPMRQFLSRFAPTDAITLTLESAPDEAAMKALAPFNPVIDKSNDHAVSVSLPDGSTLSDVIGVLTGRARVLEASRQASSLRDVYLHMTEQKGKA